MLNDSQRKLQTNVDSNESPEIECIISFEGLLINDRDEQAWFCQELRFDSEYDPEFRKTLKVLQHLNSDGVCRAVKVVNREVKKWLI